MLGIFNLKIFKKGSKTPTPPKTKTPSPPKTKTLKSILKKTNNQTKTKNQSDIMWGENKIKEISPRKIPDEKKIDEKKINECPTKVSKQDFPCKHENKTFYNKRDYKVYKLPKCTLTTDKDNKFPCKTTRSKQTIRIDDSFELVDYIKLIGKR